jgi:hypothetical protein
MTVCSNYRYSLSLHSLFLLILQNTSISYRQEYITLLSIDVSICSNNTSMYLFLLGTDKDAESLTRLFIYLGFYTNRFDNLKGQSIPSHIQ